MSQLLTFTNLFPSELQPHHGRFVLDRMRRVAAAMGCAWSVVHPVPKVPRLLRHGVYATLARMPATEEVEGVVVHHVPYPHMPGFSLRQQATRIRDACLPVVKALSAPGPTLLDAHYMYPDGVAALRIGTELGVPVVVTARGTDVNLLPERPVVAAQIRAVAGDAKALLAVCDALRDRLVAVTGLPPERVLTARNGVDLEVFQPGDRLAARRRLGLPQNARLVLGVGSLIPRKGFHHLARALARFDGDTRLLLVGEGAERRRLARILPKERLIFLGGLPHGEVARAYQACDVFVLPSSREGWPNVVTEALACGCPVVATRTWGVPEILTDDRLATMVPAGDEAALANAIRAMLAAPPDRAEVRALAERYAWDPVVAMLADLYQRCL
ncbi:MAG: glycosyltransferase [Planctomycetota bacterium]|jgi:glycosyltransferase involved in cell wall biosynthesis